MKYDLTLGIGVPTTEVFMHYQPSGPVMHPCTVGHLGTCMICDSIVKVKQQIVPMSYNVGAFVRGALSILEHKRQAKSA